MSNLINLYAYLRDKYTDVDIFCGKSPSFVKSLAGIDNQKIIFIFKEDLTRLKSTRDFQNSTSVTNTNISNEFGSPLKDDTSINELINSSVANSKTFNKNPWQEYEESYTPISTTIATNILNNISLEEDLVKNSKGWIFIFTSQQDSKNNKFLLSLHLSKNIFSRGVAKYHGVVSNKSREIKHLLAQHNKMIPRSKPEIQIESTFEMTSDVSIKFINTMPAEKPSLSHINSSSQVFLSQKIEIGKSHVLCEQLWNQIHLLNMIKNDIIGVKNNSCNGTLLEPSYNYGSMKYDDLQKKVNEVLSDVITQNENCEEAIDTNLEAVIKRVFNRRLIEITDQLWELIKYASSYSDLRKILTFILQISSRSSIVNIPMNNNRLAELIREISQQRLAIPHLSSTEPLELLLEIGIQKVMKDYEYIFSESKICLLSDIKVGEVKNGPLIDPKMNVRKSLAASAFEINHLGNRKTLLHGTGNSDNNIDLEGIRNSRFNEKESEANISKMAQIHLAIEHILMIQNNLNLDNDYKQIARKILETPFSSFEDLQTQKYDKLQISITDTKVIQLVDNLVPYSQRIIMKSDNKFKTVENTFYFNIEQIVPSLIHKENEENIEDKKGDKFHFINYMNITSKY